MKWQQLVRATQIHHRKYPRGSSHDSYDECVSVWDDAARRQDGPSGAEVECLFHFLEDWNAGVQTDKRAIRRFRSAATKAQPVLKRLRSKNLVDIELDQRATADINKAFALFSSALRPRRRGRYSWTAPSKVLHMYNPLLFLMWDGAIRAGYGIRRLTPDSYARDFLPRMQREALEAIDTFAADQHLARSGARAALERRCDGRPIAKLIDEYNIIRHRDGDL